MLCGGIDRQVNPTGSSRRVDTKRNIQKGLEDSMHVADCTTQQHRPFKKAEVVPLLGLQV